MTRLRGPIAYGVVLTGAVALAPAAHLGAQETIRREPVGFNLFSVEQDVELGQWSAKELGRGLPVVTNVRAERLLGGIVSLLATRAPGPRYPFRVQVVESAAIDAIVLPGGPIFVSRGLLDQAHSEAELAGVLAHAMAHTILRHGSARASMSYLGQAGLSALGGLAGRSVTATGIAEATATGADPATLGFGTADEYEADALGAELLSNAGYDPVAMATVFATLGRGPRRGEGAPAFSDRHPAPADRVSRIRNLVNILGHGGAQEIVGGFAGFRLPRTAHAVRLATFASIPGVTRAGTGAPLAAVPDAAPPSSRYFRFSQSGSFLAIDHPANWAVYSSGFAVSFAPSGGLVELDGLPRLIHGAVVNLYVPFEREVERWNNSLTRHYAPFEDRTRPRGVLEDATDDLVRQILSVSPWLSAPNGSARTEGIDGVRGYSVRLTGRSPVTGGFERVIVFTRALADGRIAYLACVAPGPRLAAVERACSRMIQSLRVTEAETAR